MNKHKIIFIVIIAIFLLTRFAGLGQSYHQDEYRWATIVNPEFEESVAPHPPINKISLFIVGSLLGFDNLKVAPFIYSLLVLILLYLVMFKLTGNRLIGLIASGLFTINIYSLIAGLQVDIDGAILPFFVLLAYYGYLNLEKGKWGWIVFLAGLTGGLLSKLSFILFIGALGVDYFYKSGFNFLKNIKKLIIPVGFMLVFLVVSYIFLNQQFMKVVNYGLQFNSLNFFSRAYFDLSFKLMKSVVWLSPLLLLPIIYGLFRKDILRKYFFWFVYLGLNLVFYLVLFDFANLTIERYFMFLIVPSVIISSAVIYEFLRGFNWKKNLLFIVSVLVFILGLALFITSLSHKVLPLNPKTGYIDQLKSLDLNFLIPFTGGSGPVGFYYSASFVFWGFLISAILIVIGIKSKKISSYCFAVFLAVGIIYNVFLSAEYLFGAAFGSVPNVVKQSVNYAVSNNDIDGVITYYDAGAYDLRLAGKYFGRFYTAPKRDYIPNITSYRGHYMIIDFPAIGKKGRYWPLLSKCNEIKKFRDKYVESYIIDCGL